MCANKICTGKKNTYRFYFWVAWMVIINSCITILNMELLYCNTYIKRSVKGLKTDFTASGVFFLYYRIVHDVHESILADVWSIPHQIMMGTYVYVRDTAYIIREGNWKKRGVNDIRNIFCMESIFIRT